MLFKSKWVGMDAQRLVRKREREGEREGGRESKSGGRKAGWEEREVQKFEPILWNHPGGSRSTAEYHPHPTVIGEPIGRMISPKEVV